MSIEDKKNKRAELKGYKYWFALIGVWTFLICGLCFYAITQSKNNITGNALVEAKIHIDKDMAYRRWSSEQGGVYVVPTENIPPNPHLNVPNRDVITTEGMKLTLINPAYMTRLVHDSASELYGVRGRLTSLNPIRPENKPDTWEKAALQEIEKGRKEVSSPTVEIEGKLYLRHMRGFVTEKSCLKCHAFQGYSEGDVRGGLSVLVPLENYYISYIADRNGTLLSYSAIWVLGICGIMVLRSNLNQSLAALQASEEDLKESQRIAHVGTWRLDVTANQVYWSEELYKMCGFDPLLPPPPYTEHQKLFTTESWNRLSLALQNTRDTGTPYDLELETVRPDGGYVWMWVHGMRILDNRGKIVGLRGVAQDITERKKTEEALRKSEERLNFALQMNHTGGWDLNLDTLVSIRTLEHDRIFGYHSPLSTWNYHMFIDHVVPEDRLVVDKQFQETLTTQSDLNFKCRIRRVDDGRIRWIWVAGCHLPIVPGQSMRMAGIIQDITERKIAEEEKEKLNAQLVQAQKMESVGRLAGGVAHDYNNMIGVILGYTELVQEQLSTDSILHKHLEEVLKAARRSEDITRQLLAFSRQQTIAPKRIDLNETVESMLKMLRRLIGEDIHLTWHPGLLLWPVYMDTSQLDQILVNLCVNARDAITEVGTIVIETSNITFDESYCLEHAGFLPGDFILLSVSDNGCGMDELTQEKIFEPFFTTKKMGKGTGLGLATVYGIIKQNNGFINISSEVGQGTTFKVYFPRHVFGAEQTTTPDSIKSESRGSETILLVEDEQTILEMTTTMLERLGYSILAASSPEKALELAKNNANKIHLLMSDVIMPLMNGRELSMQIKNYCPDIKVLFMSGYTADVITHRGALQDGVNFIQKPFSKKNLSAKLREVLDKVPN